MPDVSKLGKLWMGVHLNPHLDGDSEPQASMQPTIGGGISFCTQPKKKEENACEEVKEDCGMYDPNCDNFWMLSGSPVGRMGYIISFTTNEDGSVCINVGPHTGIPGPSFGVGLGGLFE
ncbi:MAG: hypothetical protein JAY88_02180 [Candidatus Thiodiazotropha lotti]|nr:hypothetical protein [Candidatus Thiodiazotropha lotti]MCW4185878.1 hypothetical protein [Candidatus Thiodiazotropha lotti]